MPKNSYLTAFIVAAALFLLSSCENQSKEEQKPLVYEGMSSQELRMNLGPPLSIDSSGTVFSMELKKKIQVERWKYEKRIVLIINDTVKDSNIN